MVTGSVVFDTSSTTSGNSSLKDALEAASIKVEKAISSDLNYTKLVNFFRTSNIEELPTFSGSNVHDYPGFADFNVNFQSLSQLSLVKRVPIPSVLLEQYRLMKSDCDMGLFPEIGRAWLTLDSIVFLWSFHDGSDLAYFDGSKDPIVSVGLAKPKKDVFQDYIQYILCLTTPYEIFLLGVSFSKKREDSSPFEEMHLLPEPLFSYPTDNVMVTSFASTNDGRIFLGGEDGCLYEFTYQTATSWFGKKCRKINHSISPLAYVLPNFVQNVFTDNDGIAQLVIDKTRNILYARTQKGSIQVFDLGHDGSQMTKVTTLYYNSIKQIINRIGSPVIHINPIEASESDHIHLMAVLQSGVRLYISTNMSNPLSRPTSLTIVHIRLPPGFSANSTHNRPGHIHSSFYSRGYLLLISAMFEDHDVVFSFNHDSFVFQKHMIEIHTSLEIDGFVRALCEIPNRSGPKIPIKKEGTYEDPPLLLTQHQEAPRKFVFLSNQGSFVFVKPRPVDVLSKLLLENRGPDCEAVKSFFRIHSEVQSCAMSLILCCNNSAQDKQVADYATRAFFLYGGHPFKVPENVGVPNVNVTDIQPQPQLSSTQRPGVYFSTPAPERNFNMSFPQSSFSYFSPVKSVFTASHAAHSPSQSFLEPQQNVSESFQATTVSPPTPSASSSLNPNMQLSGMEYSAKHDGLYLYFARIVKPLWYRNLVGERIVSHDSEGTTMTYLFSTISVDDITFFLCQVNALRNFLSEHLSYFDNTKKKSNTTAVYTTRFLNEQSQDLSQSRNQVFNEDAEIKERNSVSHLQQLVNFTYEFLGLWKVLCDHQFESIIQFLNEDIQNSLKSACFKDFFTDGREICTNLASAVINFYLDDRASTNVISQKLREVCPSIYRVEDATISKVFEIVLQTKLITNKTEKANELRHALKLCKQVSPNFDLRVVCNLFKEIRFYEGVVDICLCTAQQLDPQNLAIHFYKNGEPVTDIQGQQAYHYRLNCYKIVIDVLEDLVVLGTPSASAITTRTGTEERRKPMLSIEEAKTDSETVFKLILKSDDEIFHSTVYDWLFEKGQTDVLLTVTSGFLESYLKRRTTMHSDSLHSLDLLWKFYEKNQNFSTAAKVLSLLADKNDPNLHLSHRLEYLSRAVICIKSSEARMGSHSEGEFLHELEEKMEVARIQLQILETLQTTRKPADLSEALNKLNSNFLDITQLFEDFASLYNLPECKLAIIHCAGHNDPNLIESLWQDIFTKDLQASIGNIPEFRKNALQDKIVSLSQTYRNSEKYFPISFIVQCLETKTCTLDFDLDWVYKTMLKVGFNIMNIWSIYHKLYRSKDNCWHVLKKPLHLLQVLSLMIEQFAYSPTILPPTERRTFVTQCLDAIAGYLVDLQAMSLADDTVVTLIKDFKAIQPVLERLLL